MLLADAVPFLSGTGGIDTSIKRLTKIFLKLLKNYILTFKSN